MIWICVEDIKTYAHAYFDAFLLPVKSGDNSARSLMSVFTLSASPVDEMIEISKISWSMGQVIAVHYTSTNEKGVQLLSFQSYNL